MMRTSAATPGKLSIPIYICLLILLISSYTHAQPAVSGIDSLVRQYEKLNWNGVVIAGNKEKVLYKKAFGFANIESKKPMQLETLFKTESVGKMFTAVRIMQLIESGKLKPEQTLKSLLPDWNFQAGDKIQIQHLLTHTSGLSSPWEHPNFDFNAHYSESELKAIIETAPLIFQNPGERFYYSNSAYILLEKIIESVDKISYEKSMATYIFNPAKMKSTRALNDSVLPVNAAQPYYQVTADDFVRDTTKYGSGKPSGAGGWMSTAGDLFLFAQTYLKGKYFSAKTMAMQQTNNGKLKATDKDWRWGMLKLSSPYQSDLILGHNGGGRGFSVDVFLDISNNNIVVFCSNQWGVGYQLSERVLAVLSGNTFTMPIHGAEVRLNTYLKANGSSHLAANADSVFKQLQINKVNERLLLNVADNIALLKLSKEAETMLAIARNKFPNNSFVWYKSGLMAKSSQQTIQASTYFTEALRLAEQSNDTNLANEIKSQMQKQ